MGNPFTPSNIAWHNTPGIVQMEFARIERERDAIQATCADLLAQIARAKRNVTYADKAAEIYECQRNELLSACKAALALLTGTGQDGTLGHHPDNPVPAMLRDAIAKIDDDGH